VCGNTVMEMKFDVTYRSDYKLDIVISEGTGRYDMKEPLKYDLKRFVSLLLMLIVLIYVVRLDIELSVKLNIRNQCLNVDLVSLAYYTDYGLECYISPDYKVCAGDTMRSGFIIKWDKAYGVLIYKIQRKQKHESNENTSSTAHLLVILKISNYNELYADVLLVEYDKGFIWNEKSLEDLYYKNIYPSRLHSSSATEIWSLNDNVALMTTSEMMYEDRILNISISEVERYHITRTPVHIDLEW
jgi:hypothetical protein